MFKLSLLAWLALAVATAITDREVDFPVWILNADAVVPSGTVLQAPLVPALVAHFIGDDARLAADSEAVASAGHVLRNVPSPFMDSRNAIVVYAQGLPVEAMEHRFGSPLLHVSAGTVVPAMKSSKSSQGLRALATLDRERWSTETIDLSQDAEADVLATLASLRSKVLLVAVPEQTKLSLAARSSPGHISGSGSNAKLRAEKPVLYPPFESHEQCNAATDKCQGHGKCIKSSRDTWACKCKATKSKGYTYYWGGSDCGKRDVSVQFHLLAWSTLGILGVLGGSIALVWGLDSDPLPGILTAAT